ncbi:MAG: hypothetical protein Q8L45_10020 [Xanthomonadaceae bacterium]|nr:hypothetical protein [Xanthomonadaceae bacterium]MDP2185064.1 hypothetical protein [Xanthomonadales bacterium]MDZ4117112.1 hypothetical protein [Xanthomonadaceae bacterium]MDZ4378581.1 hypothetical protein [Xanthomonadaceae bacterium]
MRLPQVVLLFACITLISCATDVTRPLRKYDNATYGDASIELKALATQVFSFWNLHFASYTSHLSGLLDSSDLPIERTRIKSGQVTVHLEVIGAGLATSDLALQAAERLSGLRDAFNEISPFQIRKLRMRMVVVPAGHRYEKTFASIFSGDNISVAFAVRAKSEDSNEVETSIREAIRSFAHEITHVVFATHGITKPHRAPSEINPEEVAAYMVGNCVELHVMGLISKDTHMSDNKVLRDNGLDGPEFFMSSMNSSIEATDALAQLYAKGAPTITADDPRADELFALCRESIDRVVRQRSRITPTD